MNYKNKIIQIYLDNRGKTLYNHYHDATGNTGAEFVGKGVDSENELASFYFKLKCEGVLQL